MGVSQEYEQAKNEPRQQQSGHLTNHGYQNGYFASLDIDVYDHVLYFLLGELTI